MEERVAFQREVPFPKRTGTKSLGTRSPWSFNSVLDVTMGIERESASWTTNLTERAVN